MAKKKTTITATINGTAYPLKFGFKFLKEIGIILKDNMTTDNEDSLLELMGNLIDGDPEALKNGVLAGLAVYDGITEKDVETWLENEKDAEALFENFINCLTSEPLLKKKTEKMYNGLTKYMEAMEKQTEKQLETFQATEK